MAKRKKKELIFYCSRNIVVVKCFLDTNLNIPSLLNRAQKEKLGVPFQTSSDFSASLFLASLHTQGSLAKAFPAHQRGLAGTQPAEAEGSSRGLAGAT